MQRRHFLRLGACGVFALGLPRFAMAEYLPLDLPQRLASNPLLQFDGLPDFALVRPEHIKPAMDFLLQYSINAVETLTAQPDIMIPAAINLANFCDKCQFVVVSLGANSFHLVGIVHQNTLSFNLGCLFYDTRRHCAT